MGVDLIDERLDDAGKVVGGDESCAASDGVLDVVEALADVVASEPAGEAFGGGAEHVRDVAERAFGVADGVDEFVGDVGGWVKDRGEGEGGLRVCGDHDPNVDRGGGLMQGFCSNDHNTAHKRGQYREDSSLRRKTLMFRRGEGGSY
jgi:hypothetical protein